MSNHPARRRGKRRPRTFSSSRRADNCGGAFHENVADFSPGGVGDGTRGPKAVEVSALVEEAAPPEPPSLTSEPPPPPPQTADDVDNKHDRDKNALIGEIDAVLERRQRRGIPGSHREDDASCAAVVYKDFLSRKSSSFFSEDTSTNDDDEEDDDDDEGEEEDDDTKKCKALVRASRRRRVAAMKMPMTEEDLAAAHEDVFGRPLPGRAKMLRRLSALEMEVMKLPSKECRALERAMDEDPMLFENLPHARLLLNDNGDDGDGDEDNGFDAAAAALRLARYWEARRSLLGDDLCYSRGAMSGRADGSGEAKKGGTDFQRYYKRTRDVLNDPLTDEMLREDASMVMQCIEARNLEAMDTVLQKMEERELAERIEEFKKRTDRRPSSEQQCLKETEESTEETPSVRRMARETPRELKLLFLHVEDMSIVKASTRLVRYCETGLLLFGPGFKPSERATLECDMNDCSVVLDSHLFRLMPEDDDFGRSIVCRVTPQSESVNDKLAACDPLCYAKGVWYILHAALERRSCQQNGVVAVIHLHSSNARMKEHLSEYRRRRDAAVNVMNCVPVKIRAMHMWFNKDSSIMKRFLSGVSYVMSIFLRRRLIMHAGTTDEVLAELGNSYGIGAEKLPSELGGGVETEYFSSWLKRRRAAGL